MHSQLLTWKIISSLFTSPFAAARQPALASSNLGMGVCFGPTLHLTSLRLGLHSLRIAFKFKLVVSSPPIANAKQFRPLSPSFDILAPLSSRSWRARLSSPSVDDSTASAAGDIPMSFSESIEPP